MDRDSLLYKIRRKCQVLAHKVIPNEVMSKIYYKIVLHKKLNLNNPQSFNEKIQWMKLYYCPNDPVIINCSDKYTVRTYIRSKGYGDRLVPLLGVWDRAEDIVWDELPSRFVLKCNHGCAYNIIVPDKDELDKAETVRKLNRWLKEDFGAFNIEIHYSEIKHHKIICEEFLGDDLADYKFFCFNGKPYCLYILTDRIHKPQLGFFYLDGKKMSLSRDDYTDNPEVTFPPFYDEMLRAAEILCEDFPFVRVDFFVTDNKWYFAELTFTPCAGMMPFNPETYDLEWGKMLKLPK